MWITFTLFKKWTPASVCITFVDSAWMIARPAVTMVVRSIEAWVNLLIISFVPCKKIVGESWIFLAGVWWKMWPLGKARPGGLIFK